MESRNIESRSRLIYSFRMSCSWYLAARLVESGTGSHYGKKHVNVLMTFFFLRCKYFKTSPWHQKIQKPLLGRERSFSFHTPTSVTIMTVRIWRAETIYLSVFKIKMEEVSDCVHFCTSLSHRQLYKRKPNIPVYV